MSPWTKRMAREYGTTKEEPVTVLSLDNAETPRSAHRVNVTPSGLPSDPHVTVELTGENGTVTANFTPEKADALIVAIQRARGIGPTRRERAAALLTDTDIDGILAAREG